MNILNIAMLDIPEATLRLFEQVFSHASQSKVSKYFSCFFSHFLSALAALVASLGPRLGGRLVGEQKALLRELDTCYSSSSF